jgi:hypothetical protein
MNAAQLINQDSGDTEYYTPAEIVNAARATMGGIDLDPFSSYRANVRVKATRIFTIDDDGLKQPWSGKVWMNHPFSREMNTLCIKKIVSEYFDGNIEAACCITFAATSEKWFKPLLAFPQCFLSPRTNYFLPDGTKKVGVTKGSVVTYFGPDVNAFADNFKKLGSIKVAID